MKNNFESLKPEIDEVIDYNIKWVINQAGMLGNYKYYVDRAYEYVSGYAQCLIRHEINGKYKKQVFIDMCTYVHERINLYDYESILDKESGD